MAMAMAQWLCYDIIKQMKWNGRSFMVMDDKLANIDKLEIGCVYTYKKLTDTLGWKQYQSVSSNGAKAQLKIVYAYYEVKKVEVGKANGYFIKSKRKEPLPLNDIGRMKQNLTLQFPTEECYERAKELIENLLKEEGIEFKVIVAKGRNR
jgi:hypothetical protein